MPVYYSGIKEEHMLVRNSAAVFDTTHMGVVALYSAREAAEKWLWRPIGQIQSGQVRYNRILNKDKVIDDILVYGEGNKYFAVFNAANVDKDINYFNSLGVTWEKLDLCIIALQGPLVVAMVSKLAPQVKDLKYYNWSKIKLFSMELIVSRTGYTGEDGLEIFVPQAQVVSVWRQIMELGVKPAGLGARDSLRIEAGMPLYGHELRDQWDSAYSDRMLGITLQDKGMMREGFKVFNIQGQEIGLVTSATYSPISNKAIGIFMPNQEVPLGEVLVDIRGEKKPALLSKLPFVNKNRK